jgi:hypothetical protein
MTMGAASLLVFACAILPAAASAQTAANPADILAPTERETFNFTFRSSASLDANVWTFNDAPSLELNAGQKWRFTLDLDQDPERMEFDGVSAGAFFDLTPRMRLGGALSLSGDNDAFTRASNGQLDNDAPQVKFESAFKF